MPEAALRPGLILLAIAALGSLAYLLLAPPAEDWLEQVRGLQQSFVDHHARQPLLSLCAFFCAFTLCAALALPGASLLMLVAGAGFGLYWGTLVALFASTLGATLNMLAARHLLRRQAEARLGPRLAEINAGLARDGALYLFTLRMAPLIPFIIVNPLIGLTTMKTSTFFSISALGMLAGTAVYVNAGQALAELGSTGDWLSGRLALAVALLGLLPLLARQLGRTFLSGRRQKPR